MKVVNPLKVQATTKDELVLSFTISFHETQFNITLSENEVDDLRQDFERFLERN
jgi:hypothetical protein